DGVVRWLAQKKLGFPVDAEHVAPIAPAAVLYDLGRGADFVPPFQAEWGFQACESAQGGPLEQGCHGAGTGAVSGGIKGGLGTTSLVLDSGITVAAVVAVNSLGSVVNPQTGRLWEKDIEINDEFKGQANRSVQLPHADTAAPATNTTIGIVATDAVLTKVQATKIAQMAHDGLARAIRPSHTMFDGDTIFCMATGHKELAVGDDFFPGREAPAINDIGHAAAECMARAIIYGVLSARTMGSFLAFRDLKDFR
ncbi:MAG: P1 family peptidase, partial [Deltaproteobacteria bacterium]|nr:P1 family peptidase [Deltaproteobacteria bacterium]